MADHAHTPLTDTVREVYSFAGAQAPSVRKQWFDRWLATVETAAEQRGELRGKMEGFDEGIEHLSTYGYITIEVHDLALSENPYRADQIEVDDETH